VTVAGLVLLGLPGLLVFYAIVGYPLILSLAAPRRRPQGPEPRPDAWPRVSIVLPVFNEEEAVSGALDSILALEYPVSLRQILVVSDGSTDRTDEVVRTYADRGVEIVRLNGRRGKTAAENLAHRYVQGEIVVNTDASVRLHPASLKALVAAFADPTVGVASGRDVSVGSERRGVNPGESGYVGYEMWVRALETRAGGIVGASGCFFASRAQVHAQPVPEALSRDFAAPLIAWELGFRSVSVDAAVCFVPRAPSVRVEYRRKVRTMTRGLQTLFHMRGLLNPFAHGRFAFMLLSHKLIRWLVPWAMVALGLGVTLAVWSVPPLRWLVLGAFVGTGAITLVAWLRPGARLARSLGRPAYLVLGLVAGIEAWVKAVWGRPQAVWEPTRRELPSEINSEGPGAPR
jgi:cellulose synthase/poly-beta-1,6-N-acetylglucosamine synthase-like glycosyltransferase